MKVDDVIANAFVREGTSIVFGLLGDGQLKWYDAMASHPGVRFVDARDEGSALAMADGWARVTGKVGVCSVTQGPGITRMATTLVAATRYRTPLVVYTAAMGFNKENTMQYLNQERFVTATGAGYIEIQNTGYAETAVRQAFYRARLEGRPYVLAVTTDLQSKECEGSGDYLPSSAMFLRQQAIHPEQETLAKALKIIEGSERPVIVVGRGAMDAKALQLVESIAAKTGALIATTLHAKSALSGHEYNSGILGLFSSRTAINLYAEADCVIAVGTSLNNYATLVAGKPIFPKARVVHIDTAAHLVMGTGKGADCYVQGDAVITLRLVEEALSKAKTQKKGYWNSDTSKALREADKDATECEIEDGTVDPRQVARALDRLLPEDVGLVVGDGHFMSFPIMLMKKPRKLHIFAVAFGSIGQALATAIGVGLATDKPLVHIEGDGGAMQNIQELDTAVRLGLKILFIVMNDEALGAEFHKMKKKGMNAALSTVRSPKFDAVGRGFDCRGKVARTLDDVEQGIKEFLAGEGPMVMDVRVSRNVVSIPYRRMHFGEQV